MYEHVLDHLTSKISFFYIIYIHFLGSKLKRRPISGNLKGTAALHYSGCGTGSLFRQMVTLMCKLPSFSQGLPSAVSSSRLAKS